MPLKVIAFDADDTLWVNEPYFRETEGKFIGLLDHLLEPHEIERELLKTESANIPLYGYGVKAFTLSMIETALRISNGSLESETIARIIELGREQLDHDLELLDGVEETLKALYGQYRLVVATKGDLLDQERKLRKSGLEGYFHHVEIMSEKAPEDYSKLLNHLDVQPEEFLIVGNSLKSDIIPVLKLGGYGIHIPFHTHWSLDKVDVKIESPRFREVRSILDAKDAIGNM
jgi:putative hydrolase of the HAD superfamily